MQSEGDVESSTSASDAAALHPAVDQSVSDARLHDVQRLPVPGSDRRRRARLLLLCVDPASWTTLRHRHMPLTKIRKKLNYELMLRGSHSLSRAMNTRTARAC